MRLAGLLLAAGAGERFGGCKQLAPIEGKPMLMHALDALSRVLGEKLHVVLGAYANDIQPIVGLNGANAVIHHNWRQGLGSSIAHGVSDITQRGNWDGILIALGDQPLVTHRDYQQLVEQFDGTCMVAAHYVDQVGVPAIFPPAQFEALARLSGDRGAKPILTRMPQNVATVSLEAAATDIDTVQDIRKI